MNTDVEARLSAALTALAELTAESDLRPAEQALAELPRTNPTSRPSSIKLWIRPTLTAAAVAAVLVASILGIGHLGEGGDVPPAVAPTSSPTPSPAPLTQVNPGQVSGDFVNDDTGWLLTATTKCPGCLALAQTTDGGGHWTSLPDPPAESTEDPNRQDAPQIHFADQHTGYLYGGTSTLITHDGGQTWTPVAPTNISSVVSADGHTYALSDPNSAATTPSSATLWSSATGSDLWSKSTLPGVDGQPDHRWSLQFQSGELVLLRTDGPAFSHDAGPRGALWSSEDGGASWQQHPIPCRLADGGAAAISIALGHPLAWLVDCFSGAGVQQAQITQHHLYGTADGGAHWVQLADPSSNGDAVMLADNGGGHAFLTTVSGVYDAVMASLDGGATWHRAITSPAGSVGFLGWADLQFTSTDVGWVVEQNPSTSGLLYRTTDGGATWHRSALPGAPSAVPGPSSSTPAPAATSPAVHMSALASPDTTLFPALGCGADTTPIVTITINPDVPMPDCVVVNKTQRLRVVNATNAFDQPGAVITINFGGLPQRTLRRGQATTFELPFGSYLAVGEHWLKVSYYGPTTVTIWLK